jgi:hypothetical protein
MPADLKVTDIVAILGVLSALVTAVVGLIGYRWSKQVVEAKDAQINGLKEQISGLKDLSPESVKKQSQAIIDSLKSEISTIRGELSATRAKLKEKASQLDEERSKRAVSLGIPTSLFGISDYELELRRLSSFIMRSPWNPRAFPEDEDYGYEFYLKAIEFYRRDPTFTSGVVAQASEWILDFLFYPLLACMILAPYLRERASLIYQDFLTEIEAQGLLSDELPLYRDLNKLAMQGAPFEQVQKYSTFQHLMIAEHGIDGYPYAGSKET